MERKLRGRGIAASWYGIARTATIDRAGAWAELDDGGQAHEVADRVQGDFSGQGAEYLPWSGVDAPES